LPRVQSPERADLVAPRGRPRFSGFPAALRRANNGPMRRRKAFRAALRPALGASLLAALTATAATARATERVVKIPTRPGVTLKLIEIAGNDRTRPIVVLFTGGNGKVRLDDWDGRGNPVFNFLVRSRGLFAARGFHVAVPDAPSDRKETRRGLIRWRTTAGHARDIGAVIAHMRKLSSGPVALIGTSRGTISAANGAAGLPKGEVAALVLTATVTRLNRRGNRDRVQDVDLSAVTVPVLLAHHREDACFVTVPDDLAELARAFTKARHKSIMYFDGGGPFRGDDCQARAAHGFAGIEDKVVARIAEWIRAVTAKPVPR